MPKRILSLQYKQRLSLLYRETTHLTVTFIGITYKIYISQWGVFCGFYRRMCHEISYKSSVFMQGKPQKSSITCSDRITLVCSRKRAAFFCRWGEREREVHVSMTPSHNTAYWLIARTRAKPPSKDKLLYTPIQHLPGYTHAGLLKAFALNRSLK